jgi:hypothetical protein
MIRKRYDELKPGDVFRLTDGKTYILVAEVRERANGTMVEISGFRKADPPPNGQYNFSTRYLRDRGRGVLARRDRGSVGTTSGLGRGARPRELHLQGLAWRGSERLGADAGGPAPTLRGQDGCH